MCCARITQYLPEHVNCHHVGHGKSQGACEGLNWFAYVLIGGMGC